MKVLVTGSNGLCGSSLRRLSLSSPHDFVFIGRSDYDLKSQSDVDLMFSNIGEIDAVIHTAARVGGIGANIAFPESFFYDNIMINANIISKCIQCKIKKLFAFSSVCVFPDDLALLEEDRINDGPVYGANFAYGYAKRMVDIHIRAAKKQYGITNWCSIIPGNIFGSDDMFSINNGHIIPSLIHKIFLAKKNNTDLSVWGDGLSMREFIYVDDLVNVILGLLELDDIPDKIIVSGRQEISIKDIVSMLCEVSEFKGNIVWDTSKPNGQRSRPSSSKVLDSLMSPKYTDIKTALKVTYNWFESNYPNVRSEYVS
jgi:GDP-L-fucose synthase